MFKYKGQLQSKYSSLTNDKSEKNVPFMENFLGNRSAQDAEFLKSLKDNEEYRKFVLRQQQEQRQKDNQINMKPVANGNGIGNIGVQQNGQSQQNQNGTKDFIKNSAFYDQMTMGYGI